ncbi:MAG: hypothetical protein BZ136_00115, partial [Methanosphaera sp. rholeuAM74]
MSNKKTIIFVMALIILLTGLTVVSATQSDNTTDTTSTNTIEKQAVDTNSAPEDKVIENDKNVETIKKDTITKTDKEIKTKIYTVTEDNIDTYFDYDGYLTSTVKNGDVLTFSGDFFMLELKIDKNITIKGEQDEDTVFLDSSITVLDNGHLVLDNVQFALDTEDMEYVIYLDTDYNTIKNCYITHETEGVKAQTIVINTNNNKVINSTILTCGPSSSVDFDAQPNLAPIINIWVAGSNNIISDNEFLVNATTKGGNMGTIESITVQGKPGVNIYNNTITNNVINGQGIDYIYAINFGPSTYNSTIRNNTIHMNSSTYANGIQLMESPSSNNTIANNYIELQAGRAYKDTAYGIVLSSWGGKTFENNIIENNTILADSDQVYGIEVFSNVGSSKPAVLNTSIKNNTLTITGNNTVGIAVMGTTFTIKNNTISSEGETFGTNETVDWIKPYTSAIILDKVTDSTVTQNDMVTTTVGPGVYVIAQSDDILINNNTINSQDEQVTIINSTKIIAVENYPIAHPEIEIT